jgi:hypothetical protein
MDAENELAIRAQGAFPSLVAKVEPTGYADAPYQGFRTGDYVNSPAGVVRCLSIACQQDPLGYAVWTTELNARLDVPERRKEQLLQQIGGKNQIIKSVFD